MRAPKQDKPRERIYSSLVLSGTAVSAPIHHTHPLLRLHRTIGNQSVQRLLRTNKVTRIAQLLIGSASAVIQRKCAECADEEKKPIQTKPEPLVHTDAAPITIQRLTAAEKQENLKSLKYAGNSRLEAAFDNSPPMGLGESGDPVRLVQEGLVAAGFPLPRSTKPSGELDGSFGNETRDAVKAFQTTFANEGLVDRNGQPDGLVGRHTMGKLDELAGGSAPVPPQPQQPPGTSAQNQVATANAARLAALNFASASMLALQQAVAGGLDAAGIRTAFPTVVAAMDRWLKAKPEDSDFATTVQTTLSLLNQNLGASSGIGFPPASDAICSVSPCLLSGFGCTDSAGVNVCQGFLTINLDCQRDVLLHEFNHFIGMHNERADRGSITKPADAFDNADSMAEFVTELAGSPTDRCSSP